MFFRYQQTANILKVEDTFAHLSTILPNGDLGFEFVYSISQRDMIAHRAQSVLVTILNKSIDPKSLLGDSHLGFVDTLAIVNNIRTQITDAKTLIEQRNKYIVAQKYSDFTSLVNNDVLPQLRARVPTANIQHFNRPRLVSVPVNQIKQGDDQQPILQRVVNSSAVIDLQSTMSSSADENVQSLMYEMIMRQGLDPTHVINLADRSQSERSALGGMTNDAKAIEFPTDPSSRLLNFHLFPASNDVPPKVTNDAVDGTHALVLQTVTSDMITVPVTVVVPQTKLTLEQTAVTSLLVKFDLINTDSGQAVDSVVKILDVSRHLSVYNTPKTQPRVKASITSDSGRVSLEIRQVDPGASAVQVFKKAIWVSTTDIDGYSLVGTYNVSAKDQSLVVQVDKPEKSAVIYRVIAIGSTGTPAGSFSNVAVRPGRFADIKTAALTATQLPTGVRLELRHIPNKVIAVQFLSRNLTIFETEYTSVGNDVVLVDEGTREIDLIQINDGSARPGNIYGYAVKLIYRDGNTQLAGNVTLEFIQPVPGQVDTKIENVAVSHNEIPNVTFDITTLTLDTDLDIVKNLLKSQDMQQFFQGDLQTQRAQLKKLIAHSVHRIDMTSGRRENFGILTESKFDDGALRKNQAIEPLRYGHKYRYEIYPLLRAPETLFDDLVNSAIDRATKKSYSYHPAKFFHPFTLDRGVLVTSDGAKKRYAKDPMTFGVIGSIASTEVSFDNASALIVDPQASRFDRYYNVISWKIQGDVKEVDHFLIMKQIHGIRSVVGIVHSEFLHGNCQWIHKISKHDEGMITYIIVPVMNDYRVGGSATTNVVELELT